MLSAAQETTPPPISPLPWVDRLDRALAVARRGEDPEGVHQVRVATRRLVTWLDLHGLRALRDDLQRLRRSVSAHRDLDVLLERDLPSELERWARDRRQAVDPALQEALAAPFIPALLAALQLLPPLPWVRARRAVGPLCGRALRRGRALDATWPEPEALHDLRRAVRPVRYALEWMSVPTDAVKPLQEALGCLNDAAVAQGLILEWGGDAPELSLALRAERARYLEEARAAWTTAAPVLREQAVRSMTQTTVESSSWT